ncbi:MAG: radical SAM protein [Bacteroidales bacterium]|jgi:wyosine [tRNA(Phe)-imidazoG37] synthetase (radical SAM superfamily)|nr:radical SAM protein [Bacteroidales bacterium]
MATFLFDQMVFGPVKSRRFGKSLGINLLPDNKKICSFNCLYCECGWTGKSESVFPSAGNVKEALKDRLETMALHNDLPDTITFAGNGEPTLHPDFLDIMKFTIALRDQHAPLSKVAVLSNSTTLDRSDVKEALILADYNVLKLDAGTDKTFNLINNPSRPLLLKDIVNNLKAFQRNVIIQTLFFRGMFAGEFIDNSLAVDLYPWLDYLCEIAPREVMIYSLERGTPALDLKKLSQEELQAISMMVEARGIKTQVY